MSCARTSSCSAGGSGHCPGDGHEARERAEKKMKDRMEKEKGSIQKLGERSMDEEQWKEIGGLEEIVGYREKTRREQGKEKQEKGIARERGRGTRSQKMANNR